MLQHTNSHKHTRTHTHTNGRAIRKSICCVRAGKREGFKCASRVVAALENVEKGEKRLGSHKRKKNEIKKRNKSKYINQLK